ncbi:hypothetical protein [Collinsella ihumii]|uniref:Uncharacterized protein n=1 Tax=Collinsella ihumii TaxID=1720204 RepID=A0ABT7XC89_9ACTN|nr:hypothetical protein [Collinsella ihumii]MDN0062953.1 hypothetical protein [Collinsella ihumii]
METVGISLAQIVLGVLAVALAAAGAILQRRHGHVYSQALLQRWPRLS